MTAKKKHNLPQGWKENKFTFFFAKLIGSIFAGLFIAILVLQNNNKFKKSIEDSLINSLKSSLDCDVKCEIQSVNLFFPKIIFKKLHLKNQDSAWKCMCSHIQVGFSWLDLLFNGVIEIYVQITNANIMSLFDNNGLAITPTIISFVNGGSLNIPIILKSFEIKKGLITIKNKVSNYESNAYLSSITKNMYGHFKTKISFSSGDFSAYSTKILDNLSGAIHINITSKSGNTYVNLESNVYVDAQFLQNNKTCFLTGKWSYDQGIFDLQSQDESLSITPIRVYFLGNTLFTEIDINSDLKDISEFLLKKENSIIGTCSAKIRADYGPLGFGTSGELLLKDVSYRDIDCFSFGKLSFQKIKNKYNSILSFKSKNGAIFSGNLNFDKLQKKINVTLENTTEISNSQMPYWKILPKKAKMSFCYDNTKSLNGTCSCYITSKQLDTHIDILSDITCKEDLFSLQGTINDKKYFLDMFISPEIKLKQLIYKDHKNNNLFLIGSLKTNRNKLAGSIKFPFIKSLIKDYLDYDVEGEGNMNIYGMIKKDYILCQLLFKNGSVSFKNIYNFLNNFKMTCKIDPFKKIITTKHANINLHKGKINCKKAVMHYNNSFEFDYIYAPLLFDNCFVNIKNDMFALCSGRVLLSKEKNQSPHLSGLTIIERGNIKKNIFSNDEENKNSHATSSPFSLWSQNITCDLSVVTKNPMRIHMPLLKSGATINLSLKNKLLNPDISGKINFLSGSIAFPYKPLYISKGSIYFLPHQSEDPLVEVVAKNKIGKYNITMYTTGSFYNHKISFESSPPLNEEQIIALLIAGSAQESLNIVAPALIMQQLKDSLFGSGETNSRFGARNYFEKILKPFKKVRIMPNFTDQTGRGGLRGTMEIDINERFKTFVEKNFSLSEDTRFEMEYLLSDDISIRGFRRENGDIGGEVEMRWKL